MSTARVLIMLGFFLSLFFALLGLSSRSKYVIRLLGFGDWPCEPFNHNITFINDWSTYERFTYGF
jgi:hypothetical protein